MTKIPHLLPRRWRPLSNPEFGFMDSLSESVARAEVVNPSLLPDLRRGDVLFVLSDFGGSHKSSPNDTFSFLFVDPSSFRRWQQRWSGYRSRHLPDGRRMAFKSLGDRRRQKALIPFLRAANQLNGLLVTLLVSKRIPSLFSRPSESKSNDESLEEFSHWNQNAFRKMLFSVHVVSLFLAGLSAPNQDIWWYTDEDDIAPNDERLYDVCEVYKRVSSRYFFHTMRHFRFGTSRSEDGTRVLEDLISIPDLASGCLTELAERLGKATLRSSEAVLVPLQSDLSHKSRILASWLGYGYSSLRRLTYCIEPSSESGGLTLRRYHLHESERCSI